MRDSGVGRAGERLEIHNASVDEVLAAAQLCGQVHLPTGRTCTLAASHPGGCAFRPAGQVRPQAQPVGR